MKCKKCKMPISNMGLDRCYCEPDGLIEEVLSGPPVKVSCGFKTTCVKPKGTSSVIRTGETAGVHPHHEEKMIRRVQGDYKIGKIQKITPAVAETFARRLPGPNEPADMHAIGPYVKCSLGSDYDDDLKGHADGIDENGRIIELRTAYLAGLKNLFLGPQTYPKDVMWMHPDVWADLVVDNQLRQKEIDSKAEEVFELAAKIHEDQKGKDSYLTIPRGPTVSCVSVVTEEEVGPTPEVDFLGVKIAAGSNKHSFESRCKLSGITVDPQTRAKFKGTDEEYEEFFSGVMDAFGVPKYYKPIPIDDIVMAQPMTRPMRRISLSFALNKDKDD